MKRWIAAAMAGGLLLAWPVARAGQPAQECDTEMLAQAGAYLGVENFGYVADDGVVVAAACKRWPGRAGLLLAAFAYEGKQQDGKDLAILVIDETSGEVVGAERAVIQEDAGMRVERGSLRLDTAAYDLAPGVRAFGVDLESGYLAHCAESGGGPNRTLYVMAQGKLRPVMVDMATTAWHFADHKSSTCSPEPGTVVTYTLGLAVDKAVTNGYADLVVSAVERDQMGRRGKRAPFRYRMRYDGKRYPAAAMMSAFWNWLN